MRSPYVGVPDAAGLIIGSESVLTGLTGTLVRFRSDHEFGTQVQRVRMELPATNGCVERNPTMTPPQTKPHVDHRAVAVAQSAISTSGAELAILFGSRARGDYRETTSDIDVMLVQEQEADANRKREVADAVATAAAQAYGYPVSVDLVWRTVHEFRLNRHYINSLETNAVRDGIVMPRDPENYSRNDYEDEENEFAYDWTNYDERLWRAETHLNEFIFLAENGRSDLVIGQQAQNGAGSWDEGAHLGGRRTVQQYSRYRNAPR